MSQGQDPKPADVAESGFGVCVCGATFTLKSAYLAHKAVCPAAAEGAAVLDHTLIESIDQTETELAFIRMIRGIDREICGIVRRDW